MMDSNDETIRRKKHTHTQNDGGLFNLVDERYQFTFFNPHACFARPST